MTPPLRVRSSRGPMWFLPLLFLPALLAVCAVRHAAEAEPLRPADDKTLELLFTYGSEKEEWIKDATAAFNLAGVKIGNGKVVKVTGVPLGSGESIEELLSGKRKAHLTSPASAAFIVMGNAQSQAKTKTDLIGPTRNLVLSPVVIAMWKPMAEALGWGVKPIGWADILAISRQEEGWGAKDHPQWGKFKFGHTQPEFSNSGLISILAELYAATGKTNDLALEDLEKPRTIKFFSEIENSVVHYGSSTGFFGKKMFENGPEYLSAAVLYENMVIESYAPKYKDMPFPVVAVYPKEGTVWSDHPIGVVERDWVGPEHKEAAQLYIDYLLKKEQQEKAMKYGFRPAIESIPLAAPLDKAHGIDPDEPKTTLQVPGADVMEASLKLWRKHKKHARVVLVFDTSGSMRIGGRMTNAKLGAHQLLDILNDDDSFALLSFSDKPVWVEKGAKLDKNREQAHKQIDSLFPAGETALYDSIALAYQQIQEDPQASKIQAIVVLTDGEDNKSKLKLEELLDKIKIDYEKKSVRVFTVAYGSGTDKSNLPDLNILKKIADATQAKSYEGKPETIRSILKDIATFF